MIDPVTFLSTLSNTS